MATGTSGAGNLNEVIGIYVAPASGTYYLHVNGSGAAYDLVVTLGAAFDTHPNTTSATAQNITGTNGVVGYVAGAFRATGTRSMSPRLAC